MTGGFRFSATKRNNTDWMKNIKWKHRSRSARTFKFKCILLGANQKMPSLEKWFMLQVDVRTLQHGLAVETVSSWFWIHCSSPRLWINLVPQFVSLWDSLAPTLKNEPHSKRLFGSFYCLIFRAVHPDWKHRIVRLPASAVWCQQAKQVICGLAGTESNMS